MPELPEVETICRGLSRKCVGSTIVSVHVHRSSFVRGPSDPSDLLLGLTIARIVRHGKQFVLESVCGRVMLFHMGMSGSLTIRPFQSERAAHVHVHWVLIHNGKKFELHHKDPRRFGHVRAYQSMQIVRNSVWSKLGPDAIAITAEQLRLNLLDRKFSIKAALLNQSILAGVGNIYADESLFQTRIHPLRKANSLSFLEIKKLVHNLQIILKSSIHGGGSTIQDHRDALGSAGTYQKTHQVYGRHGEPCVKCGAVLRKIVCAQRTTVFCPACQKLNRSNKTRT